MTVLKPAQLSQTISKKYTQVTTKLNAHNNAIIIGFMVIYRIILDLSYRFSIFPLFESRGINFNPNGLKYVYSWMLFALIIALIPKAENKISSFFLHFQLLFTIVPLLTVYALGNKSSVYVTLVTLSFLLQLFVLRKTSKTLLKVRLPNLSSYTTVFVIIFIVISFLMALAWGGFFGLNAFNLEFLYRIRENASFPGFMNYTLNWCHAIFIPFFMIFCFDKKKYVVSFLLLMLQFGFFMVLGHKIIWLRLFVLIFCYFIAKIKIPVKALYFALTTLMLVLLVMTVIETKNSKVVIYANSFIGHRAIFYPAQLKNYYYDFFNEYPKLFFGEGQIGRIFNLQYPFTGKVGETIASYMYEGKFFKENAVTGYLGESYAQLGALGMLIMSLIISVYVKCIETFADKKLTAIFLAMIGVVVLFLNDTSVLTLMLFCGYFFLLLFAIIYVEKNNNSYKRRDLR